MDHLSAVGIKYYCQLLWFPISFIYVLSSNLICFMLYIYSHSFSFHVVNDTLPPLLSTWLSTSDHAALMHILQNWSILYSHCSPKFGPKLPNYQILYFLSSFMLFYVLSRQLFLSCWYYYLCMCWKYQICRIIFIIIIIMLLSLWLLILSNYIFIFIFRRRRISKGLW